MAKISKLESPARTACKRFFHVSHERIRRTLGREYWTRRSEACHKSPQGQNGQNLKLESLGNAPPATRIFTFHTSHPEDLEA
jgi:predicted HD phosphohydrolase